MQPRSSLLAGASLLVLAFGCTEDAALAEASAEETRADQVRSSAELVAVAPGLVAALVHNEIGRADELDGFNEAFCAAGLAKTYGISQVHIDSLKALLESEIYGDYFDDLADAFPADMEVDRGIFDPCAIGRHLDLDERFAIRAAAVFVRSSRDRILTTLGELGLSPLTEGTDTSVSPVQFNLLTMLAYRSDWEYWAGPEGTLRRNAGPADVKDRLLRLYRPGGSSAPDRQQVLDVLAAADPAVVGNIRDAYELSLANLDQLMVEAGYGW